MNQELISTLIPNKVEFSPSLKRLLLSINDKVAIAILSLEGKESTSNFTYFTLSEKGDKVYFSQYRKVVESKLKKAIYTGDGGILKKDSERNIKTIKSFDIDPDSLSKPREGYMGSIKDIRLSKKKTKIYCLFQFEDKLSILSSANIKFADLDGDKDFAEMRIGRFAKTILNLFDIDFHESDYEKFVNSYKAEIDKMNNKFYNFEVVKGERIAHFYNHRNYFQNKGPLGSSCMKDKIPQFFDLYVKNDNVCSLLILKEQTNPSKILGRALLWKCKLLNSDKSVIQDEIIFMDRVYSSSDHTLNLFKEFALKNNWFYKDRNTSEHQFKLISKNRTVTGNLLCQLKYSKFKYYPYVDSLAYLDKENKTLTNAGGNIVLNYTNGGHSGYRENHTEEDDE